MRDLAGARQGWVLVATSWLAVAAAAVVAPVSPLMANYFGGGAATVGMVQISIGLPALFVALLAGPFGFLADRIGRKRLMLGALVVYSACGIAPLWLTSLGLILLSRVGVGIAEAAVLATGTALIGDYFTGAQRDKWFAVQGGSATVVAAGLILLSGFLGQGGWRLPFAVYALPLVLVGLVAALIFEPRRRAPDVVDKTAAPALSGPALSGPALSGPALSGMPRICLVTLFTSIAFYVVLVQLPFLLTDRGFGAPTQVAMGMVASAITAPLGALIFALMARRGTAGRLAMSFAASATGLLIIALSTGYGAILLGAGINGIGSGIALPTLIGWALAGRHPAVMGRAAGLGHAAFFLGQFLSPPVFIAIAIAAGNRAAGVGVFAALVGGAALVAALLARRRPTPSAIGALS